MFFFGVRATHRLVRGIARSGRRNGSRSAPAESPAQQIIGGLLLFNVFAVLIIGGRHNWPFFVTVAAAIGPSFLTIIVGCAVSSYSAKHKRPPPTPPPTAPPAPPPPPTPPSPPYRPPTLPAQGFTLYHWRPYD